MVVPCAPSSGLIQGRPKGVDMEVKMGFSQAVFGMHIGKRKGFGGSPNTCSRALANSDGLGFDLVQSLVKELPHHPQGSLRTLVEEGFRNLRWDGYHQFPGSPKRGF